MNKKGIIYKCTCLISGKCYIGKTIKSVELRKRQHLSDSKRYPHIMLYRAFKKYGFSNFEWEIICDNVSIDKLIEKEIYYIKEYNTIKPNGYNITTGGDGRSIGYKCSEETIEKMRKGIKNAWKGKVGPFTGRKHSEETKKKMSDAQKGKIFTEEHKRNMRIARKGIVFSEEHRKNMGLSGRKRYIVITPEGEKIEVFGLKNFCQEYTKEKLNECNMNSVAHGRQKHHKGYKCIKMP